MNMINIFNYLPFSVDIFCIIMIVRRIENKIKILNTTREEIVTLPGAEANVKIRTIVNGY